jgi:hypothetical protein
MFCIVSEEILAFSLYRKSSERKLEQIKLKELFFVFLISENISSFGCLFSWRYNPFGRIFHSPVAGLISSFEIS